MPGWPRSMSLALRSAGLALAAWACVVSAVVGAGPRKDGPQGAARAEDPALLFHRLCSDCHATDRIVAPRRTKSEWEEEIREMIVEGATGSDEEFQRVLEYLLLTYGKVYINNARAEEITLTLGLSKRDGEAILAYRTKNGPFADLEALKKVPGIEVGKIDQRRNAIAF